MTKAIAYFLPQYHEIPENNEWWGRGFTEWTNVRKARSLYPGHEQPVEPLDDNYYDLLNKDTVLWQTGLANEYGVYALDYYHYWFRGRMLLEKPAENLLRWRDVDQRFMFMWANHSWTRSWTGGREVLVPMEYGERSDWVAHAEYLVPFFLDRRYLALEGRPVFQIYIPREIPCLSAMVDTWNEVLRAHGLRDAYVIGNLDYRGLFAGVGSDATDAVNIMEHTASMQFLEEQRRSPFQPFSRLVATATGPVRRALRSAVFPNRQRRVRVYSYDRNVAASVALMRQMALPKKVFFGVCTGWDNTPRYGDRGYVVHGATPAKFGSYLQVAKDLSEERRQEFVFISCWNEWAEGMVLEPTKRHGHGFLESVRDVFGR